MAEGEVFVSNDACLGTGVPAFASRAWQSPRKVPSQMKGTRPLVGKGAYRARAFNLVEKSGHGVVVCGRCRISGII